MVPEFYDRFVRPVALARYLESLMSRTYLRDWQKAGFAEVARLMHTDRPSGEIAAAVVLRHIAGG